MNANPPKHTVRTLLSSCPKHIDRRDAEILLSHVLQKPVEFFLAHPEHRVPFFKRWYFSYLLKKRVNGFPLAYLTGHKEFFGLDFVVNKHTLIPRPETELLVELAIHTAEELETRNKELVLIDVGTGSGCIPIAITKTLKHENIKTFAIDISKSALRVAQKNANIHGIDITFLRGNLLEPLSTMFPLLLGEGEGEVILTANLPYLSEEQHASEPSIQKEPRTALVADENGLALYRKLLEQIRALPSSVLSLTAFLEIDPSQSTPIQALINTILPTATVEIKKDLRGQDRVVIIKISDLQH